MPTDSEFRTVLRSQITTTKDALMTARQAQQQREVYRYSARLLDLLDRGARNGVDITGWVPDDTLAFAHAACPDG